jgi:hypothetical protein
MLLTLPVAAAFLYAAGQMDLKRALGAGAGRARVTGDSNVALLLWSLPLAVLLPGQWHGPGFAAAALAGALLFVGRIFMIRALDQGDLSLVAPILATKTILVGLISLAADRDSVSTTTLAAAGLATLGVTLLSHGPRAEAAARWGALGWAALARVFFALSDVVTQSHARSVGAGWFVPALAATMVALFPLLGRRIPLPPSARTPLLRGSAIMGFQTSMVVVVIGLTGQATLVNILYSTRSLWSVLVEWAAGRGRARQELPWRLAGAACLTAAVILALRD